MSRVGCVLMLFCCLLSAQQQPSEQASGQRSPVTSNSTNVAPDTLAQMRADLNRLDSLLSNMNSEIEFLRDQNLQILLRTNSQMWTLIIRDMREQLAREEQRNRILPSTTPAPRNRPQ